MTERDPYAQARGQMVERQLRGRGVSDERLLLAMGRVPRHLFVDEHDLHAAYSDHPLPIGHGQTLSQPFMVARMIELCGIAPADRVLEVGAGSGYQAAVLAELCAQVYGAEIVSELARSAAERLRALRIDNVTIEHRDGTLGWPEAAPFDAILVAAGAPALPAALSEQLAEGGRLVIPVGDRTIQVLQRYVKQGDQLTRTEDTACRFVDLVGEFGWPLDQR